MGGQSQARPGCRLCLDDESRRGPRGLAVIFTQIAAIRAVNSPRIPLIDDLHREGSAIKIILNGLFSVITRVNDSLLK